MGKKITLMVIDATDIHTSLGLGDDAHIGPCNTTIGSTVNQRSTG